MAPSTTKKNRLVRLRSPGALDREFCRSVFFGLRPFQYNLKNRHKPAGGHTVPPEFIGVGVAVPQDKAAMVRALDSVKSLGVSSVRLDFAPHNDSQWLDPFVDGLHAEGVKILLHLVQSLDAARAMPTPDAVTRWRAFVESALDRFVGRIEAVEAGTTINRATWAGYQLSGFLAGWEVVNDAVRALNLQLVGPNVTDFEPQYNAGVLGMLQSRCQLPDVHSNNMFSERTIEPEALDHKIAGHFGKTLIGYNLIKKYHLVAAIAGRYGIRRNWSTSAFWTLPRIERILPESEQKMADYLIRYFVLSAAAGCFERVFWGPLVSRREGLLDEGAALHVEPEQRDVVAFYRKLPGNPEEWRERPAFHALKTTHAWLAGATYVGPCTDRTELQIHAFKKAEKVFHVAWTMNGRIADLSNCYTPETVAAVERTADWNDQPPTEPLHILGESPHFLCWPEGTEPKVRPEADVLPQTKVIATSPTHRYYPFYEGSWRGLIRAGSEAEAKQLLEGLHPERIGAKPERHSMRKARNAIWTVDDPRDPGSQLVVKQPLRIAAHKRLLDRAKPSKALRSWNGTCELLRRGIPSPRPIAYFEHTDARQMLKNWFVCERFSGQHSVRSFFIAYANGAHAVEGLPFETFAQATVAFVRNMHLRGVYFRDLSGGNVLVSIGPDHVPQFSLIDTARAHFANRRFSLQKRISDLKRLAHKLNPEQQAHFMNLYLEAEGKHFALRHRFAFAAYALKARMKRIKRQARKRLTGQTPARDTNQPPTILGAPAHLFEKLATAVVVALAFALF